MLRGQSADSSKTTRSQTVNVTVTSSAVALVALGLIGCAGDPAAARCDICTSSAIIAGTVRNTVGAPVAGAVVGVAAFLDSCGGASASVSTDTAPGPTDSTGQYDQRLRSPLAPFTACVAVRAVLMTDTLVHAETVLVGRPVQFRADHPAGGPHDSVPIDVVLRYPHEAIFQVRACTGSLQAPQGEIFRVFLQDSTSIQMAAALLATDSTRIIFGSLRAGDGGFNAPWSWHLDPASITFPDLTEEVYDGCPSFVQSNLSYWLSLGRFATPVEVVAQDR